MAKSQDGGSGIGGGGGGGGESASNASARTMITLPPRMQRLRALVVAGEVLGYAADEPARELVDAKIHITFDGGHCGDAACTRCDPRYEAWQREDVRRTSWMREQAYKAPLERTEYLTAAQVAAARLAWSAQLRAKQQAAREKERAAVSVDDDRWDE